MNCFDKYKDKNDVGAGIIEEIMADIADVTPLKGFEFHPFRIGWYNECVQKAFALPYDYDTLAFVVITTPSMFENYLLPYVKTEHCRGIKDPIDECVSSLFNDIKKKLPKYDIEAIHDFELHPTRRPKVLVQTAGHVSGAAHYYQRSDLQNDPWNEKQKIYGVSVHPKYGGWFALRGVMIFGNVLCKDLPMKKPIDIVGSEQKKIELLEKFNTSWKDWSFRDVVPTEEQYSQLQRIYFQTKPEDRKQLLMNELSTL